MAAEVVMVRAGIGCGVAAAVVVGAIVVTSVTVLLAQWLHPTMAADPGFGQALGFLLVPVVLAAPLIGLVAAWKPRVGGVLGALLLIAVAGLFAAMLAGA